MGTAYRISLDDSRWNDNRRLMRTLADEANRSAYWRVAGREYGSAMDGLCAYESRGLAKIYMCGKCNNPIVSLI